MWLTSSNYTWSRPEASGGEVGRIFRNEDPEQVADCRFWRNEFDAHATVPRQHVLNHKQRQEQTIREGQRSQPQELWNSCAAALPLGFRSFDRDGSDMQCCSGQPKIKPKGIVPTERAEAEIQLKRNACSHHDNKPLVMLNSTSRPPILAATAGCIDPLGGEGVGDAMTLRGGPPRNSHGTEGNAGAAETVIETDASCSELRTKMKNSIATTRRNNRKKKRTTERERGSASVQQEKSGARGVDGEDVWNMQKTTTTTSSVPARTASTRRNSDCVQVTNLPLYPTEELTEAFLTVFPQLCQVVMARGSNRKAKVLASRNAGNCSYGQSSSYFTPHAVGDKATTVLRPSQHDSVLTSNQVEKQSERQSENMIQNFREDTERKKLAVEVPGRTYSDRSARTSTTASMSPASNCASSSSCLPTSPLSCNPIPQKNAADRRACLQLVWIPRKAIGFIQDCTCPMCTAKLVETTTCDPLFTQRHKEALVALSEQVKLSFTQERWFLFQDEFLAHPTPQKPIVPAGRATLPRGHAPTTLSGERKKRDDDEQEDYHGRKRKISLPQSRRPTEQGFNKHPSAKMNIWCRPDESETNFASAPSSTAIPEDTEDGFSLQKNGAHDQDIAPAACRQQKQTDTDLPGGREDELQQKIFPSEDEPGAAFRRKFREHVRSLFCRAIMSPGRGTCLRVTGWWETATEFVVTQVVHHSSNSGGGAPSSSPLEDHHCAHTGRAGTFSNRQIVQRRNQNSAAKQKKQLVTIALTSSTLRQQRWKVMHGHGVEEAGLSAVLVETVRHSRIRWQFSRRAGPLSSMDALLNSHALDHKCFFPEETTQLLASSADGCLRVHHRDDEEMISLDEEHNSEHHGNGGDSAPSTTGDEDASEDVSSPCGDEKHQSFFFAEDAAKDGAGRTAAKTSANEQVPCGARAPPAPAAFPRPTTSKCDPSQRGDENKRSSSRGNAVDFEDEANNSLQHVLQPSSPPHVEDLQISHPPWGCTRREDNFRPDAGSWPISQNVDITFRHAIASETKEVQQLHHGRPTQPGGRGDLNFENYSPPRSENHDAGRTRGIRGSTASTKSEKENTQQVNYRQSAAGEDLDQDHTGFNIAEQVAASSTVGGAYDVDQNNGWTMESRSKTGCCNNKFRSRSTSCVSVRYKMKRALFTSSPLSMGVLPTTVAYEACWDRAHAIWLHHMMQLCRTVRGLTWVDLFGKFARHLYPEWKKRTTAALPAAVIERQEAARREILRAQRPTDGHQEKTKVPLTLMWSSFSGAEAKQHRTRVVDAGAWLSQQKLQHMLKYELSRLWVLRMAFQSSPDRTFGIPVLKLGNTLADYQSYLRSTVLPMAKKALERAGLSTANVVQDAEDYRFPPELLEHEEDKFYFAAARKASSTTATGSASAAGLSSRSCADDGRAERKVDLLQEQRLKGGHWIFDVPFIVMPVFADIERPLAYAQAPGYGSEPWTCYPTEIESIQPIETQDQLVRIIANVPCLRLDYRAESIFRPDEDHE